MKKVLSLVLVIAMVLSSMSFAFAGTFEDVTGDYEDAVTALAALGVINGYEDGTFRPEKTVTRAEMAKILVEALGYGELVAGANSNFADTQAHWANGYVSIAAGTGLVMGYPDGTFAPDKVVTYDEALTMVVRALGYTDASLKGTWPTNYKVKAIDLDLTDDVVMATAAADRGGVAQMIYNALNATLVEVNADNIAEPIDKILLDKLATETAAFPVNTSHLDADHKDYKGDIVDLAPYMYQTIVAYEIDDEVVFVKEVKNDVVTGEFEVDGNLFELGKKDYTVADETDFYLNGGETGFDAETHDLDGVANVKLVFGLGDDDEVVIGVIAKAATTTVQLTDVFDVDDEFTFLETDNEEEFVYLPVTENDDEEEVVDYDNIIVTGDAESLEELEEDDVLTLYAPAGADVDDDKNVVGKLEIVVSRNVVEGKITRATSTKYTVDGTAYEKADFNVVQGDLLVVGKEVKLFLDAAGKIYNVEETGTVVADDYAVILKFTNGVKLNGVSVADPKVKLVNASGEVITYVLDDEQEAGSAVTVSAITYELTYEIPLSRLAKYNVNKDGEVDKIEFVTGTSVTDLKTTGNSFDLESGAVFFTIEEDDDGVWSADVVAKGDLGDKVDGYKVVDATTGKIEVLVLTNVGIEEETTIAVVTGDKATVLNDDDDKVLEYTVFIDGEEVSFLGEDEVDELAAFAEGTLVELTIENGVLVDAVEVSVAGLDDFATTGTKSADNVRVTTYVTVKGEDEDNVYLTDDVIVYVVEADNDVVIGTKADIRDKAFVAYNFATDETNDYSVVVVFEAE